MTTLNPAATKFLASQPLKLFIGGRWTESRSKKTFETLDPGRGTVIARVAEADAADVDDAVSAAQEAFQKSGWATMPATERSAILHRLATLIEQHQETIAQIESLDVGKPRTQAAGFDVPHATQTFRYYADLAAKSRSHESLTVPGFDARTVRMPYGVCGFIFPWNFPFLLLAWGTAPALAAGNTIVIKPAEDSPLSTLYFAQLAGEAGVPPGVINVVPGPGETAGAALARHPGLKRMSFTGSPEVGRLIAAACGRNLVPVKLELGGKGAAVVFDDVNVDAVAQGLAGAITFNAGQVCCTATRWFVHEKIFDSFVEKVAVALGAATIGHGAEPATQLGPLVSAKQRARVLDYLQRGVQEGGRLLVSGGRANVTGYPDGYYVKPAVMTGPADNVCAREEVFGPFAYLMTFNDEASVIDAVNSSSYGLANSVWTADLDRANRVAEKFVAGTSWINGHNLVAHGIPYGGCNQSGCGGGVLGPEALADYLRPQTVSRLA